MANLLTSCRHIFPMETYQKIEFIRVFKLNFKYCINYERHNYCKE